MASVMYLYGALVKNKLVWDELHGIYRVKIQVKEKERFDKLVELAEELGAKVKKYNSVITITGKKFFTQLKQIVGVLWGELPEQVSTEFIRGLFDFNSSIDVRYKGKRRVWRIRLRWDEEKCKKLKAILDELGIKSHVYRRANGHELEIDGKFNFRRFLEVIGSELEQRKFIMEMALKRFDEAVKLSRASRNELRNLRAVEEEEFTTT